MLSIRIEKEIRQENKILAGLTLRQLLWVIAGVLSCIFIWYVTGLDLDDLVIPWASVGLVCGAFGWVQKDGLHLEDYIERTMQRIVFHNSRLCYRTANQYVRMYNQGMTQKGGRSRGASQSLAERKKRKERRRFRSRIKAYR